MDWEDVVTAAMEVEQLGTDHPKRDGAFKMLLGSITSLRAGERNPRRFWSR